MKHTPKTPLIVVFLFALWLVACGGANMPTDKRAVMVLYKSCGTRDTVTIEYYKWLELYGDYLRDANNNTLATGVGSFSIIKQEEVK